MTCREKLAIERPKLVTKGYFTGCPHDYGYTPVPNYCDYCDHELQIINCERCWEREVEEK